MSLYSISALEAETLVDQLQARGFARYCGDPREVDHGVEPWTIDIELLPGVR
jgi:hypothetical protein